MRGGAFGVRPLTLGLGAEMRCAAGIACMPNEERLGMIRNFLESPAVLVILDAQRPSVNAPTHIVLIS